MGIIERKEREKKLRKKQIEDAALDVFMRKDFNSATIDEIADKAELSPATIYLYFRNKQELYGVLHLQYMRIMYDNLKAVHDNDSMSIEEKIKGYKDAMYNAFSQHPILLKIIFHMQIYNVLPTLDPELLDQINSTARSFMNMMADTYDQGVDAGILKEGHGIMHADIFWAMFSGLVVWEDTKKQIDPRKDFLKPSLDRAFDIIFWGIQKD